MLGIWILTKVIAIGSWLMQYSWDSHEYWQLARLGFLLCLVPALFLPLKFKAVIPQCVGCV